MKIHFLSPEGVLEVEQAAFREIEKRLPSNWVGWAAFQLIVPGSNPLDVDLLVLTENRILVVELKNWYGVIESSNGQWIHNGKVHRSPVDVTTSKARKLHDSLRSALTGVHIPYVEPLIVLCNPKVRPNLAPREKQFVMTLADFCGLSDKTKYLSKYPQINQKFNKPSSNPLISLAKYTLYFSPQSKHIREIKFSLQGYEQDSDHADYIHPKNIFEEFLATHKESKQSKALMRRWDFRELSGGNTTATERANIALREIRLNEHVRLQSDELHKALLEPIGQATAEEVTTNFTELYRLSFKLERLDRYLHRREQYLSYDDRLELVKSILSRYSQLHNLGIAHRDISLHSLWVEEPFKIAMSSFSTAYFPEHQTISSHRIELETGDVILPEDILNSQESTPFLRDVFLLGVVAFRIITGNRPILNNGVPQIDENQTWSEFHEFESWFKSALSWDPSNRFTDAGAALDRINSLTSVSSLPTILGTDFDAFRTQSSFATHAMVKQLSIVDGKFVYLSNDTEGGLLVKIWTNLNFDLKRPLRNRNLMRFLETARSMRLCPSSDYPLILDFGLGPMGLVIITRWIEGLTLSQWLLDHHSAPERGEVSLELLKLVSRLHSNDICHGDIKPDNIIVRSAGETFKLTVIDLPDIQADGEEGHTPAFSPPEISDLLPKHRDLYSVAIIVSSLIEDFSDTFVETLNDLRQATSEPENGVTLELVLQSLEKELNPKLQTQQQQFVINFTGKIPASTNGYIPNDNGKYHVSVEKSRKDENGVIFSVLGVTHRIELHVNLLTNSLSAINLREQGHVEYVRRINQSDFILHGEIVLQWGASDSADEITTYLINRAANEGVLTVTSSEDEELANQAQANQPSTSKVGSFSTRSLWGAMVKCEQDNATSVTVLSGATQDPTNHSRFFVPFDLESGTIDFNKDEQVLVLSKQWDPSASEIKWRQVAKLNAELTNGNQLAIEEMKQSFSSNEGTEYRLRGRLDDIALGRRQLATERILNGRGLISNIPELFDRDCDIQPTKVSLPNDLALDLYELNIEQKDALINTLEFGPISLLQGPPGTGKTKFISAFIHCVLSNQLAKNVLLVSQSHEAINHALSKTNELAIKNSTSISMVRVGQENMLSENVKPLHDLTLQQKFRERFSSEIKVRIFKAAMAMGMPADYAEEAISLHLNLGELVGKLNSIDASLGTVEDEEKEILLKQRNSLTSTFHSILSTKYQFATRGIDFNNDYSQLKSQLARKYNVNAPANIERLHQLVELSLEFRQVLGNPRANFTPFLTRSRQVVAGTCVGIGRHAIGIVDHAYDWVIIDEAARSSPTELAVAMQAGRRILLVGDHKQLPPNYSPDFRKSIANELNLKRIDYSAMSDFARAFQSNYGKQCGKTLFAQYRMVKPIGDLVSKCFYEGKLRTERGPAGPEYDLLPQSLRSALTWIDTSDQGEKAYESKRNGSESRVNEIEATTVLSVLRCISESTQFLDALKKLSREDGPHIGVICMYAAQRDLIRQRLNQSDWATPIRGLVNIGTVDSYQGKENKIIILSLVLNNNQDDVGFMWRSERINVALSRAMDRLFIVGATAMWRDRKASSLHSVIEEVRKMHIRGEASLLSSKEFLLGASS
jgi:serine/threonine protein kinase